MGFGLISNIVHSGMEALQKNSFKHTENFNQESRAEIVLQP